MVVNASDSGSRGGGFEPHSVQTVLFSTKRNIQLLENIQRRATRLLPQLRGYTYSERLESLKLPTLLYRRKRYDLIQLYKKVHGFEDIKAEKIFEFNDNCTRGHLFKIQKKGCKKNLRDGIHFLCDVSISGTL